MVMRAIHKNFSQIQDRDAIERWAPFIHADTPCIEATCSYGDVIATDEGFARSIRLESPLGFILSGNAELCEASLLGDVAAYRPIGTLDKGDIFGDFSVLDNLLGESGPTRRKEQWELVAGGKSVHIIGTCKEHIDLIDNENIYQPFLFLNKFNKAHRTRLLILSST